MALPQKELRFGVPDIVHIYLDAAAGANKLDKNDLCREIMEEWAGRKAHEHKLAQRALRANGVQPDLPGFESDDSGLARKGLRR